MVLRKHARSSDGQDNSGTEDSEWCKCTDIWNTFSFMAEKCIKLKPSVRCYQKKYWHTYCCIRGGLDWILGKHSLPEEWLSTEIDTPGQWSWPQVARDQEVFGQHSKTQGVNYGLLCVESGLGMVILVQEEEFSNSSYSTSIINSI